MFVASIERAPQSSGGTGTDRRAGRERRGRWLGAGGDATRQRPKSVVVVDQRRLIVDALVALLGASGRFLVTALTPTGDDASAIAAIGPDVVLFGVGEVQEYPLRMVESLHHLAPEIQAVIVADTQDPELIHCVLDQGVAGLVLTASTGDDLSVVLDQVLRGQTALPAGWQAVLASADCDPVAALSDRQLEVLRLLAEGCTYDQIASQLVITVNTVKFHVRSIYLRLGVGNRMAARKLLEAYEPRHIHAAASQ
jgi:two-component system, NarL family, nitrate/nitrite response regulator NarL